MRQILVTAACCVAFIAIGCGGDNDDADPTASAAAPAVATATVAPEPLIVIEEPAEGASVTVPVAASGTANTFEAALTVDILDSEGNELCARHIMATSGSGTPGTWETSLAVAPPDTPSPAVVRAYEFSAMDGSMINVAERAITLSAERPTIFVTEPDCGAVVAPSATLAVSGRAAVFEAALTIELRDASGAVVVAENVMAASGVEEADFTGSLAIPADAPNGFYDLVAYSFSAMDGSIQNEFVVQIVVEA
jgi:hypothetical protein